LKTPLQLLSQIEIASPCPVRWDEMTGNDRVRHCVQCDKQVYDISTMTAQAAYDFLVRHETSICIQLYKRKDGTVLTADCPVGVRERLRRRWRQAVALVASMFAISVTSGCDLFCTRGAVATKQAPSKTASLPSGIPAPDSNK
jgi:hypothetical protein